MIEKLLCKTIKPYCLNHAVPVNQSNIKIIEKLKMKLATCNWGCYRFKTYISVNIFMMTNNLRSFGKKFMKWARLNTSFIINHHTASQYDNYFSCRIYDWELPLDQLDINYVDLQFDLDHKTLSIRITVYAH